MRRSKFGLVTCMSAAVLLAGCSGGRSPSGTVTVPVSTADNVLTAAEVTSIATVAAASVNVPLVIAVSDRRGYILAIYHKANAPTAAVGNFSQPLPADDVAAGLARTAAYFSNDQAPIGSRTVRYLSGIHFPPGILGTEAAPLYGIENTNRGCGFNISYLPGQQLPVLTSPALGAPGSGAGMVTGKKDVDDSDPDAVNPGGVPIFKNNRVAGGIGVVAADGATAEYAAVAGTLLNGFAPTVPAPGAVVVGGVSLPFVEQTTVPAGESAGSADGSFTTGPAGSAGAAPEGDLITETGSTLGGLALADVEDIVQLAVAAGNQTRAVIRLPPGARARFVIAVADLDGRILALYRMPDATMFSVDVSIAKARNVVYFSGSPVPADLPGVPPGTAVTNRTIGFAAQPFYPSGQDGTAPGPFFTPLFLKDVANPCTQGSQSVNANQNGIVFFPGSVPLYRNGVLVGGLGVSGDGVDQDDYVASQGAVNFAAPVGIRADNYFDQGVRLTYQKFPRDPTQ